MTARPAGLIARCAKAILAANANANGTTITFAPGVTGAITLTHGELLIERSLTINGPLNASLSLSGNNLSRIFHVTEWNGRPLQPHPPHGFAEGYSFGLFGPGGDGNGGGILNEATLTLTACT